MSTRVPAGVDRDAHPLPEAQQPQAVRRRTRPRRRAAPRRRRAAPSPSCVASSYVCTVACMSGRLPKRTAPVPAGVSSQSIRSIRSSSALVLGDRRPAAPRRTGRPRCRRRVAATSGPARRAPGPRPARCGRGTGGRTGDPAGARTRRRAAWCPCPRRRRRTHARPRPPRQGGCEIVGAQRGQVRRQRGHPHPGCSRRATVAPWASAALSPRPGHRRSTAQPSAATVSARPRVVGDDEDRPDAVSGERGGDGVGGEREREVGPVRAGEARQPGLGDLQALHGHHDRPAGRRLPGPSPDDPVTARRAGRLDTARALARG